MPTNIDVEALPNQEFSIRLDAYRYNVRLNSVSDGAMCATIQRDGVTVIDGVRCVAGRFVLPYAYLEGLGGNFFFDTPNDEIPDYQQFGTTHFLVYLSAAELGVLRG
jgi:hypothetical protein